MASLINNVVFTAASGGTGAFGVSAALTGYQTPAAAGATDTKTYRYRAESGDKSQWEIGTTVASSTATSFTRVVTASSAGGTTTVNFTNPPTVAIVPQAADILQFDDSMSLTASQKARAQSNIGIIPTPQGRLTLQSGAPVMKTDQVGSQNLYYAPFSGSVVPVRVSGEWLNQTIISSSTDQVGQTLALAGSANWAAGTIHDVFEIVDGGVAKLGTRLWDAGMFETEALITGGSVITTGTGANAWSNSSAAFDGTVPQAIATCARIPVPSNAGLANRIGKDWGAGVAKTVSKVVITAASNNNLQGGGSTALQIVIDASNDGTNFTSLGFFYVDASAVGTAYTIPINIGNQVPYRYHRVGITGNASYSINVAEIQFYEVVAAANGRRLTKLDGIDVNNASMTVRTGASTTVSVAQYEGTFLGVIKIDAATAGQITAHNTYGPDRVYNVWNAYNQRRIVLRAGVITNASSYTLTAQRWQLAQTGFSLSVLQGLAAEYVPVTLARGFYIDAQSARKAYEGGIGVDNTVSFSGVQIGATIDLAGTQFSFFQTAYVDVHPFAGSKTFNAIERTDSGGGTCSPFTEQRSTELRAEWLG